MFVKNWLDQNEREHKLPEKQSVAYAVIITDFKWENDISNIHWTKKHADLADKNRADKEKRKRLPMWRMIWYSIWIKNLVGNIYSVQNLNDWVRIKEIKISYNYYSVHKLLIIK